MCVSLRITIINPLHINTDNRCFKKNNYNTPKQKI